MLDGDVWREYMVSSFLSLKLPKKTRRIFWQGSNCSALTMYMACVEECVERGETLVPCSNSEIHTFNPTLRRWLVRWVDGW